MFKWLKRKPTKSVRPIVCKWPSSHSDVENWMNRYLSYLLIEFPDTAYNAFNPSSGNYLPMLIHVGCSWNDKHQQSYRELKLQYPELVDKAKQQFKISGQYSQSRIGDSQDYDPDIQLRP